MLLLLYLYLLTRNVLAHINYQIHLDFKQHLYKTHNFLNLNKIFQQCGVLGVCGKNVQYYVAAEHVLGNSYAKARRPRNAPVSQEERKKTAILEVVVSYLLWIEI